MPTGLVVDEMSAFTSRTKRLVQYAGGFTINRETACAVNNSRVDDRIDKKKSWRVQQSRDVWGGGWVPLSAETTLKSGVEESTRKHRETYPQLMPAPGGSAPPDTPRHASDTTPTSRVELERWQYNPTDSVSGGGEECRNTLGSATPGLAYLD